METTAIDTHCAPTTNDPFNVITATTESSTMTKRNINANTPDKLCWTRLNYKGIYHDNRRLLKHRAKNCECFTCCREIYKLPPGETHEEYVTTLKTKIDQRAIKRAKERAKKEVKTGKQKPIDNFFLRF